MKILVVDDEEDVQLLFKQRFRKEIKRGDFSFDFAYSGEEALTYLETSESKAVPILSDINMPGMSGLELLQQVKEKYKNSPPVVIMITAYGDDQNYRMAMDLGADDFLTKPLEFTVLKEKLKGITI